VTLKLTQRALNYLADREPETVQLSFFAHNVNGISQGSRSIGRLHGERV
jgi:hypothetical protein